MNGQGFTVVNGEEVVDEFLTSVIQFIRSGLEIHLSESLQRKYGDERPENPIIFILSDNTITGNITGVIKYMTKLIAQTDKSGGELLDFILSEIRKIDVEISENVA